mgnify:CR=1 FL=1
MWITVHLGCSDPQKDGSESEVCENSESRILNMTIKTYTPLGHRKRTTFTEYVAHIAGQLSAMGVSKSDIPLRLGRVWEELLQGPAKTSIDFQYDGVDVTRSYAKGKRPVAAIIYKLTSHGNLSVNWQPYAVRPYSGDWKGHPIQESLGPHRPRSELFFMRDFLGLMSVLKSDADRERRFGFSEKSLSFIGSDLVSAIDAAIKESLEPYQCFVELRILNGIKCDTEKVLLEGSRYETPVITNASISKANMRALPIGD